MQEYKYPMTMKIQYASSLYCNRIYFAREPGTDIVFTSLNIFLSVGIENVKIHLV